MTGVSTSSFEANKQIINMNDTHEVFELVGGRHMIVAEPDGSVNLAGDTLLVYDTIASECCTVPNLAETRIFFNLQNPEAEEILDTPTSPEATTGDRLINWTHPMTLLLISPVQAHKDTGLRVEKLWAVMSQGMKEKKYVVNPKQCEYKWKNLRKRYLQVKDGMNKTGSGKENFTYFENFEGKFGKKHNVEPLSISSNLTVKSSSSQDTSLKSSACSEPSIGSPTTSRKRASENESPSTSKRRRGQEDWLKTHLSEKQELLTKKIEVREQSREKELLLKERAVKAIEALQQSVDKIFDKL